MTNQAQKTGLFIANYQIGESIPGGIIFQVNLIINAVTKNVYGCGDITQATNPPLDVRTKLTGDYTYMTVMPNNTHILINATGYPDSNSTQNTANVELHIVLESDWQSGVANYKYRTDQSSSYKEVTNAKVKFISSQTYELTAENAKAAANLNSQQQKLNKKAFG